uniref:NADH-ubiquinone oxidoreductase chain 5 n=1 Tax=Ghauriana sinensis TaxID=2729071 RepID=A0A6M3RA79_9HEMI|nr:NADH dehydrogenase subunit 5 [Ghauriana sinensis]
MNKINLFFTWGMIMLMLSLTSFLMGMYFYMNNYLLFIEWSLISLNSFNLIYPIMMDSTSMNFSGVVCFISSMVVFYSSEYMGIKNFSSNRFLFLVIMFVISMLMMIMSPNMISILLGWDGLGLISYCLVIYYNSMKSYLAGMLTCLVNRLGDIGLIISVSWLSSYGSWHFMFYLNYYNEYIYILVIISSFTKSAQIPFSMWLPAAMAAPTPVSALVHSSTLVTAGVYLLIRFFNLINFKNSMFIFISLMTLLMSSLSAIYEFDLKKIIALSTLSQLGLMMTSLFLGLKDLSLFHLCTHAMFKSLLFLCAGIYIFYMNDNQDIRYMSSISLMMPFTSSCFMISNMALCGIPFLSGFYSKDLIMESSSYDMFNLIIYLMFYLSLSLTVIYTIRLMYYSLIFNNKGLTMNLNFESLLIMKLSITMLTLCSIIFGCYMMWILNLNNNLLILTLNMKLMTFIMILLGIMISKENLMIKNYLMSFNYYKFTNMWLMYNLSYYVYMITYKFTYKYQKLLNWGELYGPMGMSLFLIKISNFIQNYSINNFKIMLISFLIWLVIIY